MQASAMKRACAVISLPLVAAVRVSYFPRPTYQYGIQANLLAPSHTGHSRHPLGRMMWL